MRARFCFLGLAVSLLFACSGQNHAKKGDLYFQPMADLSAVECSDTGWRKINPYVALSSLRDLWVGPACDLAVVGDAGIHVRSPDCRWYLAAQDARFSALWGASSQEIYACGDGGRVVAIRGTEFAEIDIGDSSFSCYDVWGDGAGGLFVLGIDGTSELARTVWRYADGAWERSRIQGYGGSFQHLFGAGPNDVYVLAQGWTVEGEESCGELYRFDGESWALTPRPSACVLYDAWAAGPDDVFMATQDGVFRRDGEGWNQAPGDEAPNGDEITGGGPDDVWVFGDDTVWRYDGAAWSEVPELAPGWWFRAPFAVAETGFVWAITYDSKIASWRQNEPYVDFVQGDSLETFTHVAPSASGNAYFGSNDAALGRAVASSLYVSDAPIRTNAVWAAGSDDLFAADSWTGDVARFDGNAWEIQRSDVESFQGVFSRAADDVFAVGASTANPIWHFNGATWSAMAMEAGSPRMELEAVLGGASGAVYAVGTKRSPNGLAGMEDAGAVLRYDGFAWSEMDLGGLAALGTRFGVVTGTDGGELWVAGRDDLLHYDGASWTAIDLSGFGGEHAKVPAMWAEGTGSLYAVISIWMSNMEGEYEAGRQVAKHDGGGWSDISLPFDDPRAIGGTGPDDVVVTAGNCAEGDCVVRFDGASWTSLGDSESFWSSSWSYFRPEKIAANGADDIVLAGERGGTWEVWSFDGASWTRLTSSVPAWGDWNPYGVDYADGVLWLVGPDGAVWSHDGVDWAESRPENPCRGVYDLWGAGPSDVLAVCNDGGALHWDGATWTATETGTDVPLIGLWGSAADDAWAIGANDTLLRWDGSAWSAVEVEDDYVLTAIWGSHADNVFVAGYDRNLGPEDAGYLVLLRFDGASWSAETIPETCGATTGTNSFIESLWGFESGGVTELYAVTGRCSAPDTDGTFLHYDGVSWGRIAAIEDPNGGFRAVGGTGPDDIWLAGDDGLLLHYPCE